LECGILDGKPVLDLQPEIDHKILNNLSHLLNSQFDEIAFK
jgi:hypothetical protein